MGIPSENILWLGHDDGELEYVPPKLLCGQATKIIRQYRPDAIMSVDPGEWHERWHKTDHRMAAFNTIDAVRAAEFHLYYPEHRLVDKLEPITVTNLFFFYATDEAANYHLNIDATFDLKVEAISRHVSQFEPSGFCHMAMRFSMPLPWFLDHSDQKSCCHLAHLENMS